MSENTLMTDILCHDCVKIVKVLCTKCDRHIMAKIINKKTYCPICGGKVKV